MLCYRVTCTRALLYTQFPFALLFTHLDCDGAYQSTFLQLYTAKKKAENSKQIYPGNELRGYSPNVSVCDLYIPLIGTYAYSAGGK
jgi:hypothetical protein